MAVGGQHGPRPDTPAPALPTSVATADYAPAPTGVHATAPPVAFDDIPRATSHGSWQSTSSSASSSVGSFASVGLSPAPSSESGVSSAGGTVSPWSAVESESIDGEARRRRHRRRRRQTYSPAADSELPGSLERAGAAIGAVAHGRPLSATVATLAGPADAALPTPVLTTPQRRKRRAIELESRATQLERENRALRDQIQQLEHAQENVAAALAARGIPWPPPLPDRADAATRPPTP